MSTKITFRSEPARNPDTGYIIPFCWNVTLLINGVPFISEERSESSEERFAATTRAAAFSLARNASFHPSTTPAIKNACENIRWQFEKVEWVR